MIFDHNQLKRDAAILCGHDGTHKLRTRGNRRKGYIYAYGTSREVRIPRGVEPLDYLAELVPIMLDGGCEIASVDGEDTDTPLTLSEGADE